MTPTFARVASDSPEKCFTHVYNLPKHFLMLRMVNPTGTSEILKKEDPILEKETPGYILVFRPYITLRNGRRLYAREKGKRVFAFWVSQEC